MQLYVINKCLPFQFFIEAQLQHLKTYYHISYLFIQLLCFLKFYIPQVQILLILFEASTL